MQRDTSELRAQEDSHIQESCVTSPMVPAAIFRFLPLGRRSRWYIYLEAVKTRMRIRSWVHGMRTASYSDRSMETQPLEPRWWFRESWVTSNTATITGVSPSFPGLLNGRIQHIRSWGCIIGRIIDWDITCCLGSVHIYLTDATTLWWIVTWQTPAAPNRPQ